MSVDSFFFFKRKVANLYLGWALLTWVLLTQSQWIDFLFRSAGIASALSFRLLALSASLLFLLFLYGCGVYPQRWLQLRLPQHPLLNHLVCFLLGYSTAALLIYLLGLTQQLRPFLLYCIFGIGCFLGALHCPPLAWRKWIPSSSSHLARGSQWFLLLFLVLRLFSTLNYISFGDPLFYNLPVGRDYLALGGFQWLAHAEWYFQAGLSDFVLIYLHNFISHSHLFQLTAQAFYYWIGIVGLSLVLVGLLFSTLIAKKHVFWLTLSLLTLDYFHIESIVAKPDYFLGGLVCLIIAVLWHWLRNDNIGQSFTI